MKFLLISLFLIFSNVYAVEFTIPIDEVGRTIASNQTVSTSEYSFGSLFQKLGGKSRGFGLNFSFVEVGSSGPDSKIQERRGSSGLHSLKREVGVIIPTGTMFSMEAGYVGSNVGYQKSEMGEDGYFSGRANGIFVALSYDYNLVDNFYLVSKLSTSYVTGDLQLSNSNYMIPGSYDYGQYGVHLSCGPQYRKNRLFWGVTGLVGRDWVDVRDSMGLQVSNESFFSYGGSLNVGAVL